VDIEIRPVGLERYEDFVGMVTASFGEELHRDEAEDWRPIFEGGRNLAAFEGDAIVGSAGAVAFEITVPGGAFLPAAGVTSVGVLPTHRRRGVLRALMRRQLDDVREQGQPLAYLWASEAVIYQRFGYGLGTLTAAFDILRQGTAFPRPFEPGGRMRLVDRADALKAFPSVYDRVRPVRPGMPGRDEVWWHEGFRDPEYEREGASPFFFALHESAGSVDGYVAYRIKEGWGHSTGPHHSLEVEELVAATDEAYASLWRYCFDIDLVRRVKGWKRPIDEPLLHMLVEPRALGFQVRDGTWLRIVDAPAALEGRRYGVQGRLVLVLRDEFCPWNEGRWALEGGPEGASCRSVDAEPDLELGASELAAMYLGAVRPSTLARAGRLSERREGALKQADAMFASDVAPWCPFLF